MLRATLLEKLNGLQSYHKAKELLKGRGGEFPVTDKTLNTDHQEILLPPKDDDPDLESDGNPSPTM